MIGAILLLATVLRLVLINQSLWLDESIEALAVTGRMGPLLKYALADFQPPLYHFVSYAFTHFLGSSEVILRLPSLLAGIGAVYFVWKFGELWGGRRLGLIAALLSATNPLLIYYSQEGRTYALTTFFVTASMYYLLRIFKLKTISPLVSSFYVLFTIFYLWTSYLSWFLWFGLALYLLIQKNWRLLLLHLVAASTLLLWLPSLLSSLSIGGSTLAAAPSWGQVVGGLSWKSLPLTWVKFVIGRVSFTPAVLYAGVVSVLAALHLFALKGGQKLRQTVHLPLLLIWLVVPAALGILAATILPVYQYFRVLFVLPAYLLLLALSLSQERSRVLTGVLIGTQLATLGYFWFSPRFHREDWRSLVQDIRGESLAAVALPSRAQNAPLLYYQLDLPEIEPKLGISGDYQTVYYIRYAEELFDVARQGPANMSAAGYTLASQKVYPGLQLDVYTRKP